jgi:AraC-like DNA-binding protein
MAVHFILEDRLRDSVTITPDPPPFCKPFLLPDAMVTYTDWDTGGYLTQEIFGDDYTICEYRFYIKEKVKVYPITSKPLLTLVYALKGTVNCFLQGFGTVDLDEGYYYFIYVPPDIEHEANFIPGDYVLFHINLDAGYITKLANEHDSVKEILNMKKEQVPTGMRDLMAPISLRARVVIEQITQCKEEGYSKDMFLQGRIYDLLQLYSKDNECFQKGDNIESGDHQVNKYIDKLLLAKNIIDTNAGEPISITSLSRKIGLNKQVLKNLFKTAFGSTIYAYQIHIRMERACQLLLQPEVSIDSIAAEIGYKNTSSFINMFRKLFGLTPLQYHKRYNK